jgi:hypothetical protein
VDRRPAAGDRRAGIPTRITRAPRRLWEPGDGTGTTIGLLTWVDDPSSTIHRPYYHH